MNTITEGILMQIAGDIEALLLEQQKGIAFSFDKITEGIKISVSVSLDQSADGVVTEYNLSYPLEPKPEPATKATVKKKRIINENQGNLIDAIERLRPDKDSGIESVTLSARGESVTLKARQSTTPPLRKGPERGPC